MKERLTGAIILVVLIVLLVPELLSGPSRSAPASRATTAPASSEEPPLRSYTIDLADESHNATPSAGTSGAPPQASGPAQPPIIEEHTAQDPAPAQQPNGSASSQPSPEASEAPQQPVQTPPSPPAVAAPPRPQPQVPARQAPPVAQHPSEKQPAPQQQRYAATEKRPSPEREHAEKSSGWTVQVGVFAKQANAERLVKELQEQGFHSSVSENTSSGRTLYWVRTTPVAERATAEQLSARLRAAGHVGSVVPK